MVYPASQRSQRLLNRSDRADLLLDRFRIRELPGGLLGMDQRIAEGDLVDAAIAGNQRDARELVEVVVENVFRQTGGFSEVSSRGAVLDRERSLLVHPRISPLG